MPFSPPPLLILAFQSILFHTIVTEGHYTLFSIEEFFFKKNRAELFDCGVSNDMSKVTLQLVCIVLTQCFCFASSVRFGSFCLASSETGVAFLQENYYCTHQFA